MRIFPIVAFVLVVAACGAQAPSSALEVRWPPAQPPLLAQWRASVAAWEIAWEGRRFAGTGARLPPALRTAPGPDVPVRIALWLESPSRPRSPSPTFVGDGTARHPVRLRLLDRRWALGQPETTR